MRNENSPIAVEGYPFLAGAALITVVFALLMWKVLMAVGFFVTVFIAFFFRNPQRACPDEKEAVVAPADGVVIYMGEAREEHVHEEMLKISIFMSVFNVHVNRSPVSGRVMDNFYKRGKFLDVRNSRSTFENEQSGLVLETDTAAKVVVVQVAGLIARRIVCYAKKGSILTRGARYGLIRFGSRLDVYVPKGNQPEGVDGG